MASLNQAQGTIKNSKRMSLASWKEKK